MFALKVLFRKTQGQGTHSVTFFEADKSTNALNWDEMMEKLTAMADKNTSDGPGTGSIRNTGRCWDRDFGSDSFRSVALVLLLSFLAVVSAEGARKPYIPPPLRIYVPFETCWNGIHEVLEARQLSLVREDRGRGLIISDYKDYISGPLTAGHLAKIGQRPELRDGAWLRVQYQFEALVELVSAKETVLTVNANVRALKRDFLGTEQWVDIPSNGELEAGLLTEFGKLLFGSNFELTEPKPGFWERDPTYVPEEMERIPKIAGPERP